MTTMSQRCSGLTRRQALSTTGGLVALGAVAACSDAGSVSRGEAIGGSEGEWRFAAQDTDVGGVTYYAREKILIVQPSQGEYRAFSSVCPHQGCAVSATSGEDLVCPCHNSSFDRSTGALIDGPATSGLAELDVQVDGSELLIRG